MHGRKFLTAGLAVGFVAVGADAQPARRAAVAIVARPLTATLRAVILKMSSKVTPNRLLGDFD
jgi:hypothetical protein